MSFTVEHMVSDGGGVRHVVKNKYTGFKSEVAAVRFCRSEGFGTKNSPMEYRMDSPKNGWESSELMSITYKSES